MLSRFAFIFALAFSLPTFATDLYFDADGDGSAAMGGSGVWDSTSMVWRSGTATGPLVAWINDGQTIVHFGGTAGSVSVTENLKVSFIHFDTTGYTIGGGGVLSLGAFYLINVPSGTATINCTLSGSGLNKTGPGTLVLNGVNTYAGGTSITDGKVVSGNRSALSAGPITLGACTLALAAQADLSGFGGSGTGWQMNGGAVAASDVLTLTDGGTNQARSAFANAKQAVNAGFTARFVYTATGGNQKADGATFCIQNYGTTKLGAAGAALGWGFPSSNSLQMNVYQSSGSNNITNGTYGNYKTTFPVDLASGHPISVSMTYDPVLGGLLQVFTDQVAPYPTKIFTYQVNLQNLVGSTNAWVGFTGSTGGATSTQTISNFQWLQTQAATYANDIFVQAGPFPATIEVMTPGIKVGKITITQGNTLNVSPAATLAPNSAYDLNTGNLILNTLANLNINNNGTAPAIMLIEAFDDGGVPLTLNKGGDGALVSNTAAINVSNGTRINVTNGILLPFVATAFGTGAHIDLGATAVFNLGVSNTIGALSGTGSVTLNGYTLTVGSSGNLSSEFSGVISNGSGAAGINKDGGGTLKLSGTNTYTGTTTVRGGTLMVNGTTTASAMQVNAGGALSGTGTLGAVTVSPGGTLAPGNSGAGKLSMNSLALDSNSNLYFDAGTATDLAAITGNLTLGGVLNVVAGAGLGGGSYTIMTYGGTRTDRTVTIVNPPGFSLVLDLSQAGKVNLTVLDCVVSSIVPLGTSPTNASPVNFGVYFATDVTGVDATDFRVTTTGTLSGAAVTQVTQVDPKSYSVTVNTGTGEGTLRLDLIDDNSISSTLGAKLGGPALNDGDFTTGEVYTIDRTGPTVTVNQGAAQQDPTETAPVIFTVVFNEAVTDFTNADVTIGGTANPGTINVANFGDNRTFTVALSNFAGNGEVTVSVPANVAHDTAGNANSASTSTDNSVTFDPSTAPVVVNVTSADADGNYKRNDVISIAVVFNKTVYVSGAPELALNSGAAAKAIYVSGSGLRTLVFAYTVGNGDSTFDLDYSSTTALTKPGAATIRDGSNRDAQLTLPEPGAANSLGANKDIAVDSVGPTVAFVDSATNNGTYGSGAAILISVHWSEPVVVDGSPKLNLQTGRAGAAAIYAGGSETDTLQFIFTVVAGDSSADLDYAVTTALEFDGGTIADEFGNGATLTLPAPGAANSLSSNAAIVLDTTPTVSTISPNSGVIAGGAQITLSGTNLDGANATFGGTAATTGSSTPTTLTVTLPAHAEGVVDVVVTGAGGSVTKAAAFTYLGAPTITSISPNAGPPAGNQAITISGANFVSGTTVKLGGTSATNVVVVNSTTITAVTPAHAAGSVDVLVTTPFSQSFTLPSGYTYNSPPALVSTVVTPNTPIAGRPVTITVVATDSDGDTVAVIFDWGDGSGSQSSPHAYSTGGSYSVTITLSDGVNTVAAQTLTLDVIGPAIPLTISKMAGKFSFKSGAADSVQVSSTIPNVDAGFSFAGKTFHIDVGGAIADFTLDAKGKAKTAAGSLALKFKSKKGVFSGGPVAFTAKLTGNFDNVWLDEGIDPAQTIAKGTITMVTDVVFTGKIYSSTDTLKLSSKAGVGGKFSK